MKRLLVSLAALVLAIGLVTSGCTQAAKTAEPTKAPAPTEPTKAAQPTKTETQPTVAALKKPVFPEKGKTITMIIGFPAGGTGDIDSRIVAGVLEKELGVPVQVINKAGAGGQLGFTDIVRSKPDGYTIGYTPPPAVGSLYLDPARQTVFARKDFQTVAGWVYDPGVLVVMGSSPYKSMKDLIDAAKASPEKIKIATGAKASVSHFGSMLFQKLAGIKLAGVLFDGSAESRTALLGGHVDVTYAVAADYLAQFKSGLVRVLGISDKQRNKYYEGVMTMAEQGIDLDWGAFRGFSVPTGTPREIVDILNAAIKRGSESSEVRTKMEELGEIPRYMNPEQFGAFWDAMDERLKVLIPEVMSGS